VFNSELLSDENKIEDIGASLELAGYLSRHCNLSFKPPNPGEKNE